MKYKVIPPHGIDINCETLEEAKKEIKNMADGAAIFEYWNAKNHFLRFYKVNGRIIKQ
jgi:hypothetical protein